MREQLAAEFILRTNMKDEWKLGSNDRSQGARRQMQGCALFTALAPPRMLLLRKLYHAIAGQ